MDALLKQLDAIALEPSLKPFLQILKSARNGAVYGTKIRFPHALVMVFLFRSGTVREKIWLVYKATRQHARNLAYFATVYKSSMLALQYVGGGKEGPYDSFFAGLTGGYVVFGKGKQGSVNQQIVIYVFARVCLAFAKLLVESPDVTANLPLPVFFTQTLSPEARGRITANAWPVFASLSWAMVMFLFRYQPDSLQSSLRSSMKYIYQQCDHWDSFRNLLIHNQ